MIKSLAACLSTDDYRIGQRVQAHPATDIWMCGARYGTVVKVGRKVVHVQMDHASLKRPLRFSPDNLLAAD